MKPITKFSLKDQEILKKVQRFARARKVRLYLVGGILRDIYLGRTKENLDFDFCLKKGAINFARKLAGEIKAGFVVLDKKHGACRLVKKINEKFCTLDFTDFRGRDLEEDLLHRDFTINAFAVELEKALGGPSLSGSIIDPYAGRADLDAKRIRMLNKKSFDEDPLRILRAFSFACIFGFKIDKETLKLIKLKKNKLRGVSCERIRDELFKIFDAPDTYTYLGQLDILGILRIIMPELEVMRKVRQGPYHHLDVWEHSLETIRQLDLLIIEFKKDRKVQDYLGGIISYGRTRRALLKLGALLHDIGKPKAKRRREGKTTFYGHERVGLDIARNITKRLKLSGSEENALGKMIFCHLRPGYLADHEEISPRAIFRYFRDTADEAASVLLISIADQRSTKGRLTTRKSSIRHERVVSGLIKEYFRQKEEKKPQRLINGDILMKELKLFPSPLIGKILSEIDELQAIGKVKDRQGALKAAKRMAR